MKVQSCFEYCKIWQYQRKFLRKIVDFVSFAISKRLTGRFIFLKNSLCEKLHSFVCNYYYKKSITYDSPQSPVAFGHDTRGRIVTKPDDVISVGFSRFVCKFVQSFDFRTIQITDKVEWSSWSGTQAGIDCNKGVLVGTNHCLVHVGSRVFFAHDGVICEVIFSRVHVENVEVVWNIPKII